MHDIGQNHYIFNGRECSIAQNNVESANQGTFSISFPLLETNTQEEQNNHPVTGSDVRLVLFGRFHESNTCSRVEALRRIRCIKELQGKFNREVAEQLHASFNKDKHFLNQMSPDGHIFLFRSLIDLRNEDRNQKFYRIANQDTNFHLNIDSIGRATFSNEFAPYDPDHLDHDFAIYICEQKHNSN